MATERKPKRSRFDWMTLLFYGVMLVIGLAAGSTLCLGWLAGPVAGAITALWLKPSREKAFGKGALAGLVTAVGELPLTILLSLDSNERAFFYLGLLAMGLTVILGGWFARIVVGLRGPQVSLPATASARLARLPRLSQYAYRQAELVGFPSQVRIICPSCKSAHEIESRKLSPLSYRAEPLRVPVGEETIEIVHSGQHYGQVLDSELKAGAVVGGLAGGQLGSLAGGLFAGLLGKKKWTPIWLVPCLSCRAQIPIVTDGTVFLVSEWAVPPE